MVCLYCGSPTKVTNSRTRADNLLVWRRRSCQQCKAVFTTLEQIDRQSAVAVKKRNGHIEPFLRDKLLISVYDSLKHRKTALTDATALSDTIIRSVLTKMTDGSLKIDDLVSTTHLVLLRFDKPAAVYYASFHMADS